MRIGDWECVISPDGNTRAASCSRSEGGSVAFINGRLVAHADAPREVMLWLLRPLLRQAWDSGCVTGLGAPPREPVEKVYAMNPYNGEPPNKDHDPS